MKEISLALAIETPECDIEYIMNSRCVDRNGAISIILARKDSEPFLLEAISKCLIADGFVTVYVQDGNLAARMNIVITDEEYDRIFKIKSLCDRADISVVDIK